MEWSDNEFDELAAQLRGEVGSEFRLEAEALEDDAAKLVLRRRTLGDIAVELMNRGDEVGATAAGTTISGVITHAAGDLAIIETSHSTVSVNLAGPISLRVVRRAQAGGRGRANGSPSYRSRMLELEMSGELVEIVTPLTPDPLVGTISVVGADHVVVIDRDQTEQFVPLSAVAFTIQR